MAEKSDFLESKMIEFSFSRVTCFAFKFFLQLRCRCRKFVLGRFVKTEAVIKTLSITLAI